ncbi:hypothetical protein ACLM5H_05385 [Fredinandcohnia humi]
MSAGFSLSAWDIRRLFEIAISFYIRAFFPYLLYLFGIFLTIYYEPSTVTLIIINSIAGLLAFLVLFQVYSAWTMSRCVKKIVRGKIQLETLFTVKEAKARISRVIIFALITLAIYMYIVTEITLPTLSFRENLLLWLMLGSWIVLGFVYGYSRFFIDRGRSIIEKYGNIVPNS